MKNGLFMENENLQPTEKKETTKEKKKLPKWANITITVGVCLTCCGAGVAAGIVLSNFLSFNSTDYGALNIEDYEDDLDKLVTKYKKTDSHKYLSTFTPYELATIARYNVTQHTYAKSVGIGLVNAAMGVKQTVRSYYLKSDNQYFFESISKSKIVGVNKRFYQDESQVTIYTGSGSDPEKATWKEEDKTSVSIPEYEETWGRELSRCTNFIISSKTTLLDQSSATQDGNNIVLSLELDPLTSVLRYVKNMKAMSDLDDYPTFHKVHIDMTLDENLNVISSKTNEVYDVKSFGVTSKNTSGSLEETYTYDQKEDFPNLTTDCNYTKGE